MRDKSILFFVGKVNVGGAGKMIKYVANLCANHFKKVYLYSFYDSPSFNDINKSIVCGSLHLNTSKKLWRVDALRIIRSQVKDIAPDICCVFVSDVAVMCRIATLGLDITFVSAERGDPYTLPILWKKLVTWTYNHSDYCFFQLEKAKLFFTELRKENSFVIPNPYFVSKNIEPYVGERKNTIVTATRFEEEKGVDILIKAFAKIHPKYPNYRLVLYGSGSKLDELKSLIDSYGISEFVSFPGYINNVAEAVREDGIFVLPSRYEGIPNTLIEVLAVGVPVITSDCSPGGPDFLTNHGERGLLFEIDNVDELCQKLELLLNDNNLVKKLEKKSIEIKSAITVDKINKQWLNAFEKISINIKK